MIRVAFFTFGCKVNRYETQAMREIVERAGFEVVDGEEADVFVINTCTVTGVSDRKARKLIRRLARERPDALIVVTGCYAERAAEEIKGMEGVGLVLGNEGKREIASRIAEALGLLPPPPEKALWISRFDGQTRALVKVEDGCDSFCAYCIVPYVRGRVRSRPVGEVVGEARRLVGAGYKEIVITGIHLGCYGKDWGGRPSLEDLLRAVAEVDGIGRIRLSSLEPMDVTPGLLKLMASDDRFAHHLHLPLQSGSDKVLRLMRRPYTREEFERIVDMARSAMPDIGITTDIIVGFPGEGEEEFRESYEFVERMAFSRLHVFRFSPRKGTLAERMPGRVPEGIVKRRSEAMIELGRRLMREFAESLVGTVQRVLLERKERDGRLSGFTGNYVRVFVRAPERLIGKMVDVMIEGVEGENAVGRVVGCPEAQAACVF